MLSSEIRLNAGFASSQRLMLMGLYNMAISKSRLSFMVTTEAEAVRGLADERPGLLMTTAHLEQGSGLSLVEQARDLVPDIRTILIVDGPNADLVATGRSSADAVLWEADCFGEDQALVTMIRTLAVGKRYRSAAVLAAMHEAAVDRTPWRDAPPDLTSRELQHVDLLVDGLGDREIGERMGISYETARSRGKALRRKLGVSTRAQVVARALQLGLSRLGKG